MGHRVYEYSVESSAPPDAFIAAATDFSEKRLHYWHTISPKTYKVHSIGDRCADVTEGEGPVWTRAKYTWTDSVVSYSVVASNAVSPGDTWEMRVAPREDAGSVITTRLEHNWHGIGILGQLMAGLVGTERFFTRDMRKTARRVEAESANGQAAVSVANVSI